MQSEFNQGAQYCRDNIISTIIGMQNGLGCDETNPQYQILQELMIDIEEKYGNLMKPFKG